MSMFVCTVLYVLYRPEEGAGRPGAVWKPPFRDAVDVILDSLAGIAQRYIRTGESALEGFYIYCVS